MNKCPKTVSGKHAWIYEKKVLEYGFWNSFFITKKLEYPECSKCGIINDKKRNKVGRSDYIANL